MKPQVYFGACDRQMETFLDCSTFRQSIVHSVLFQGDLVIPDIYFYISNLLSELIDSERYDSRFFNACIRNGAVIPAFRREANGSFVKNLKDIQDDGIQGVHEKAVHIANKLEKIVYGKRLHSIVWPSQPFSIGYKKTIERVFLADNIPLGANRLDQFWEKTIEFRTVVVGETAQDSTGGFRRGDIYNAVARYLSTGSEPVQDIREIWERVEEKALADSARRLLKWINYCYYYNHGRMFSVRPSLSSLDALDTEFARHLAELDDNNISSPVFKQGFRLPSVDALLTVDPSYIFEVRDSEVGADYFSALADWQQNPSEEAANVLLDKLECYTSKLCGTFIEHGRSVVNPEWFLRAIIPSGKSRLGGLGKESSIEVFKEIAGNAIPFFGLMSLVGKYAAATYESLPTSAQEVISPLLGIGKRIRIEAEEKTIRISEESKTYIQQDATFE